MRLDLDYHLNRYRVLLNARSLEDVVALAFVRDTLAPAAARLKRPAIVGAHGLVQFGRSAQPSSLETMRALCDGGLLKVMGQSGEAEADGDAELIRVVEHYASKRNLVVVTQRRDFADTLRATCPPSKAFVVARVKDGALHAWPATRAQKPDSISTGRARPCSTPVRFATAEHIVSAPSRPVGAAIAPDAGASLLMAGGGSVRLEERIAAGGEAVIYTVDRPGRVAKIYKPGKLTDHTLAKLDRLCGVHVDDPALCWPEAVLHTAQGEPVGYLMRRAEGRSLARSAFIRPALAQHFPDWRRHDLVIVAIAVAAAVDRLHAMGVVLGDINAENILVRPDRGITLVDLDSVQVEGYPCPVGTPDCTRAVNQGKPYASYLRSVEDDRFALAIMLFKILLPGKHPFAHAGGERPADNIRAGSFPYPFGGAGGEGVPDGGWRNIWSHLSYKMQQAFFATFALGELRTAAEWGTVLRRYAKAIDEGRMDPDGGNHIFPQRRKRVSDEVQAKFGLKQPEWQDLTCRSCARPFQMPIGRTATADCPDCRKAARLAAERLAAERSAVVAPTPYRTVAPHSYRPSSPTPSRPAPQAGGRGLVAGLIALIS